MKSLLTLVVTVLLSLPISGSADSPTPDSAQQKAVLVTGASSGIGKQIALTLADNGFFVYAGARKAEDIEALSALPNMLGIRLDVTIEADIDDAHG